eukprot:Gb_07846 [translate_table: standard]
MGIDVVPGGILKVLFISKINKPLVEGDVGADPLVGEKGRRNFKKLNEQEAQMPRWRSNRLEEVKDGCIQRFHQGLKRKSMALIKKREATSCEKPKSIDLRWRMGRKHRASIADTINSKGRVVEQAPETELMEIEAIHSENPNCKSRSGAQYA